MHGSKNLFFSQSPEVLRDYRKEVIMLLGIKDYNREQVNLYLEAFDYFSVHREGYDGATSVPDLCDLPGLDLDALLHDYHYLYFNAAATFKTKEQADNIFKKGISRKGKSGYSSWTRKAGLWIASLYLLVRARRKYGKITPDQKNGMYKHYRILSR